MTDWISTRVNCTPQDFTLTTQANAWRAGDAGSNPGPLHLYHCIKEAYMMAVKLNDWMKKIQFPTGEMVVLHSPTV